MSIREYQNVSTTGEVIVTSSDPTYLVSCDATASASIEITLKEKVQGNLSGNVTVSFTGSNITRQKGSWIDDDFDINMLITVTGTTSNDGTYTVTSVSDDVLVVSGTFVDETDVLPTSIVGNIPDTDWFVHETVASSAHTFTYLENGPTGLRITNTAGTGVVRAWVRT